MASKRLKLLQEQLEFLIKHKASKEEIAEIEKKIAASKIATKAKRKGASYEVKIAGKFNKRFPALEMVKTPSSGGFQKSSSNEEIRGDISNLNKGVRFMLHVECKNQKTWKLKDWLDQAEGDCPADKIPLVVFHQQQEVEDNKVTQKSVDYVALKLDDLLKIVNDATVVREMINVERANVETSPSNEAKPSKTKKASKKSAETSGKSKKK